MKAVKRSYRSPTREAQAARTRGSIVEATRRALAGGGLKGTTMETIARDAGVAVQTVYAVFGSKAGILAALLEQLEAEADPGGLARALERSRSPIDQARAVAHYHRRLFERGADVIAASVGSVATDPEVAAHVQAGHDRRRRGLSRIVHQWQRSGHLRSGLGAREATDIVWALASPELYLLHTVGSGWSPAHYERWLTDAIAATVDRPSHRASADRPT